MEVGELDLDVSLVKQLLSPFTSPEPSPELIPVGLQASNPKDVVACVADVHYAPGTSQLVFATKCMI